ncbi:hypothetical protein MLD38_001634 [Melastoma candidum]|uniref:Uncharacterized protein n=1 Tax=Melastoma candidum TaxID=119954 RepID=A0ACB9SHT7_9MYRT|nr:hypothetical protein MLD38_001634 [Melastoma candidum]
MKKATPSAPMQVSLELPLHFLVAIAIFLPLSSIVAPVYSQNYLCYDQDGNFTSNETYGTTLDSLLGTIATMSSNSLDYGFLNVSVSRPQYHDDIQVLGVCSGDVTSDKCRDCLNRTSHQVRQLCPTKKQATLFEDECWIRYSNVQLYGLYARLPA